MKSGDIEKLRQSLADTLKEDELKKAIQGIKEENIVSSEKKNSQKKKVSNEIDEEIAEDIDENPVDLDFDVHKSSSKVESFYHAGKPISIRKARPISATYHDVASHRPIEPIYAAIPFQNKQYESLKKNFESVGQEKNEFRESTPFEKMTLSSHNKSSNPSSTKLPNLKETKDVLSSKELPSNFAMRGSKQEKIVSVYCIIMKINKIRLL